MQSTKQPQTTTNPDAGAEQSAPAVQPQSNPALLVKQHTEAKIVKHIFTQQELNDRGAELARTIAGKRGTEAELDQVKADYKHKIAEADAKVDKLSTSLMNGFEMREMTCRVEFCAKEGKKKYYLADAPEGAEPVAIEDMTTADYEMDLLQAEGRFECREEIPLWQQVNGDSGILVVGRLNTRWFSALRISISGQSLHERLDSLQRSVKRRPDAVKTAAKRAQEWLNGTLGKDGAKGFADGINNIIEQNKEREE